MKTLPDIIQMRRKIVAEIDTLNNDIVSRQMTVNCEEKIAYMKGVLLTLDGIIDNYTLYQYIFEDAGITSIDVINYTPPITR